MSALNGWHRGERQLRTRLKFDTDPALQMLYSFIDGEVDAEHANFTARQLPFIPVVTLDAQNRPWSSLLAGADGRPGFIRVPRYSTLAVNAKVWEGDPILEAVEKYGAGAEGKRDMLIASLGIDFTSRRRFKLAGKVNKAEKVDGTTLELEFVVNQYIGNCPKYISVRDFISNPARNPTLVHRNLQLGAGDRLSDEAIALINQADTVFFGTAYLATTSESMLYPSHLGLNQRGGRPGFVRVSPSDGKTVYLPDFSGNRIMTSLGNVEATPAAGLTFVNFLTGDILYVTGDARNLMGAEAHDIMPFQQLLTEVVVTGYSLVRDALPVRQRPGSNIGASPYSPPIRYLKEEMAGAKLFAEEERKEVTLRRIEMHTPNIATFYWDMPTSGSGNGNAERKGGLRDVKPGQAAILDFKPLLGAKAYQHMAPMHPAGLNDDRVRTWTIASAVPATGPDGAPATFGLTMKEKPGGVVTGALFAIARKLAAVRPEVLEDARPLELRATLLGVDGAFVLPDIVPDKPACDAPQNTAPSDAALGLSPMPIIGGGGGSGGSQVPLDLGTTSSLASVAPQKLLFVAGGIGVTPFLRMLQTIAVQPFARHAMLDGALPPALVRWDIKLWLSTREPGVLLALVGEALGLSPSFVLAGEAGEAGEAGAEEKVGVAVNKSIPPNLKLSLVVFDTTSEASAATTTAAATTTDVQPLVQVLHAAGVDVVFHAGRVAVGLLGEGEREVAQRDVYVCGPPLFERALREGVLKDLGVDETRMRTEGFEY